MTRIANRKGELTSKLCFIETDYKSHDVRNTSVLKHKASFSRMWLHFLDGWSGNCMYTKVGVVGIIRSLTYFPVFLAYGTLMTEEMSHKIATRCLLNRTIRPEKPSSVMFLSAKQKYVTINLNEFGISKCFLLNRSHNQNGWDNQQFFPVLLHQQ